MPNELPGNALSYFPPEQEREFAARVPECHRLYIGPPACGRRHAIHALEEGDDNLSFLCVSEADAVSGRYEDIIGDGIEALLPQLASPPKALLLYFNCVDDFLGTDEEALLSALQTRFPTLPIRITRIDPVSLGKRIMPGMLIQSKLFSFLEPAAERDGGVNLISPGRIVPDASELVEVLLDLGVGDIRQLARCKTYDEYQRMAVSALNIDMSFMAEIAVRDMEARLGIPYLHAPTITEPESIADFYNRLANALGRKAPDFRGKTEETRLEMRETAEMLQGMPITVDDTVGVNAFELAKTLLAAGFSVKSILAMQIRDTDRPTVDWIREKHPEIIIKRSQSFENLLQSQEENGLVLGKKAARLLYAPHWVHIGRDEDYFGFKGLCLLMEKMRYGAANPRPFTTEAEA